MIERDDLIPVCPKCGSPEWLISIYLFHPASGSLVKQIWQCSHDFENWSGCGWSGPAPQRVRATRLDEYKPTGIPFHSLPPKQQAGALRLQNEGELILVLLSDGSKEVVR